MKRGFYVIMAAQFFSSLADNALLIAAIALLRDVQAPAWMTPMLKLFFVFSYVALAAFVGAFADSFPKARVMFITNMIKIGGCMMMFLGAHPLLAYAVIGFGAAAYSPAKYGIVTELLPPEKLVVANGWIEGLTVTSIIVGFLIGGVLIDRNVAAWLLAHDMPVIDTGVDLPAEAAISVIVWIYVLAAAINLMIGDTGARYVKQHSHPWKLTGRVCALLQGSVARQARADIARSDDAVLGRWSDAAIHRSEVGRNCARARSGARGDSAGGRCGRNHDGCGVRSSHGIAEESDGRVAGRDRDGRDRRRRGVLLRRQSCLKARSDSARSTPAIFC